MNTHPLRILMYHRILDAPAAATCNPSVISATPSAFREQMRFVATHYSVMPSDEVVAAIRGQRALPSRALLITFDDGCRDFGEVAWPILRQYRLPATVFVPTAYPDCPERSFWWDRLHCAFRCTRVRGATLTPMGTLNLETEQSRRASLRAVERMLKRLPHAEAMAVVESVCGQLGEDAPPPSEVLGWDALRELARDGAGIGAHTRTHPALTQLPTEQARAEIRGSREDLERELGTAPEVFAYPFGDHDDEVAALVQEEGFSMAMSCRDGHSRIGGEEDFRLRRTNITPRTTPLVFRVRLTVVGSYVDRWRHARPTNRAAADTDLYRTPVRRLTGG